MFFRVPASIKPLEVTPQNSFQTHAAPPPPPSDPVGPSLCHLDRVQAAWADPDKWREALAAWGAASPAQALLWARSQTASWRGDAIVAVLTGAAQRPRKAVPLVLALLAEEPALAAECGQAFVDALNTAGEFQAAIRFAAQAPGEFQQAWLAGAFTAWSRDNPTRALAAFAPFAGQMAGTGEFYALADRCAATQPSSLANYALALPDGETRDYALTSAVNHWSLQDPESLSEWLSGYQASPVLDRSIALLVSQTDETNSAPDVAIRWAERITEPELRFASMREAARNWNAVNPAAARDYVSQAAGLSLEQRAAILQDLGCAPVQKEGRD